MDSSIGRFRRQSNPEKQPVFCLANSPFLDFRFTRFSYTGGSAFPQPHMMIFPTAAFKLSSI
jgi:hypothetical protein